MELKYLADNSNKIFNSFLINVSIASGNKKILFYLSWIPEVTALVPIEVNCCMYSCMHVCMYVIAVLL